MADKTIGDLTQAESIGSEDLFVLEQNSEAKKLKGSQLVKYAQDAVGAQVTAATQAAENAETAKTGAESAQTQAQAARDAILNMLVEAITLEHGSPATVERSIVGSVYKLTFGLPSGKKGDKGDVGPANTLTIGTVTSGIEASATITGDAPNQVLNLVLEKGDKGDPGEKGADGAPGKDGVTPEIVEGELVTVPSVGGGTDLSLGITGATVGQIAKITAVDTDGKPTAWSPVDMTGGGGGETWELIAEIDFDVDAANDVSVWEYKNLPNYKEIAYRKVGLFGSTETASGLSISINGSLPQQSGIGYAQKGKQSNGWGEILLLPFGWIHVNSGSANLPTNYAFGGLQTIYNAIPVDGDSITSVRLSGHPTYKIAGGKLSLYGRR